MPTLKIRVSEDVKRQLLIMKVEHGYRNLEALLVELIEEHNGSTCPKNLGVVRMTSA